MQEFVSGCSNNPRVATDHASCNQYPFPPYCAVLELCLLASCPTHSETMAKISAYKSRIDMSVHCLPKSTSHTIQ